MIAFGLRSADRGKGDMRSGLLGLCLLGLAAAPAAAAVEHSTLDGGVEAIFITGDIRDGDDAQFGELSRRFPRAVVYLESAGGALMPAIEIGKRVHAQRHATAVLDGSVCTSACALIWIAGSPRYLGPRGRLGFHASYSDEGGRLVETGVGNAMVGHYLAQLDLPEDAAVFATIASPYEINWLTAENSGAAGIRFEVAPSSLPVPRRPANTNPKLAGGNQILRKAQTAK